jgi:two-component system sensor histidine kinase CssS
MTFIPYLCEGVCFIYAGILLMRFKGIYSTWKYITGSMLMTWGLFYAFFYFIRAENSMRLEAIGDILTVISASVSVMGFLILGFLKKMNNESEFAKYVRYMSHDLKTQATVIRNYAQMIVNGIYPNGSLEESVQVIKSEVEKMDKEIRGILYLNKLNYLSEIQNYEEFNMAEIIMNSVSRFRWRRNDLEWKLDLEPIQIKGDREQWAIAIDNFIDNQVKYAYKYIKISLHIEAPRNICLLRIWNDGPHIDPDILEIKFREFLSGKKGDSGLGMVIIKKVLVNHNASLIAENLEDGVAFSIEMSYK